MRLYLVQHGIAKSKEDDTSRSLSRAGMAELLKINAFINIHAKVTVDTIYHSSKTRARQTAEILAEQIKPKNGLVESEDMNPMDDPAPWAQRAGGLEHDTMLVGHLPHLRRLASLLLCGDADADIINFKNGGVVCLSYSGGDWSLRWAVVPDILT